MLNFTNKNDMKNEFIPYEQACELKWLGFKEDCLDRYHPKHKELASNISTWSNRHFPESLMIPAPLYQQAFRWFRKNHIFYINMTTADIFYFVYYFKVGPPYDPNNLFMSKIYRTYEEAELELLKKLIELSTKKPEGGQI
jgi:trehalose utilization protein